MENVEHEIFQAAGLLEQLHRKLADLLDPVRGEDEQLAGELGSVVDSLQAAAAQLTGIASRWHHVER